MSRSPLKPPSFFLFLILLSSIFSRTTSNCNEHDFRILMKIKRYFNNPPIFWSWDASRDCCTSWEAIACLGKNASLSGHVTLLSFIGYEDLSGPIPFHLITQLRTITRLRISDNSKLTGIIPPSIAKLTSLTQLIISNTSLSGCLTTSLCKLPQLDTLVLSDNRLTGRILDCLGTRGLTYINLGNNTFSGHIPESFGGMAPNNTLLFLQQNQLTGEIPRSLGKIDFLAIDLSDNRLIGDASFLFGENKSTSNLLLARNELDFDITNVSYPFYLVFFDVSDNKLTGSISPQIAKVNSLIVVFNVSYNRLCGPVPEVYSLRLIDAYYYRNNSCLCGGPLPPCQQDIAPSPALT